MQRDYLLREIEKIGQILSVIRQKLVGGKENLSISVLQTTQEVKEMLFDGLNFDFEKFITLDAQCTIDYLSRFEGFSIENIESLADLITDLGFESDDGDFQKYLIKALQLYELCNIKSNTYSANREVLIGRIKSMLEERT